MSAPTAHPTPSRLLHRPWPEVRALQDRLLARTIELCHTGHPYYARVMRENGLRPEHLQTCDDLVRLPPTAKEDFLSDPEAFQLSHPDLAQDERTIWKIMYTSGTTTGVPAPILITTHDHYAYMWACRQREDLVPIRPDDTIASLFPLAEFPMGAYARAPDEAAAMGAGIIFGLTGRGRQSFDVHHALDDAVAHVARHRATVLWGVASFIRRVLIRAAELGADFSAVRMAMITGEATSRAMREDMAARMLALGCAETLICNRYGSTEQGSSMVECCEGSGFHSLGPDQVFHEVLDPDSGARLADGETGMLAFTHLIKRGTVLLRYLVGDRVSIDHAPCPHCGRTSPRVASNLTRSGDLIKVRGMLVNLRLIKDMLEKAPEVLEYQIVLRPLDATDPFSMDQMALRIAPTHDARPGLPDRLGAEVEHLVHLRPVIELCTADQLFDPATAVKPVRVIDQRNVPAAP